MGGEILDPVQQMANRRLGSRSTEILAVDANKNCTIFLRLRVHDDEGVRRIEASLPVIGTNRLSEDGENLFRRFTKEYLRDLSDQALFVNGRSFFRPHNREAR
ncbi:hypothetical protein N7510_001314 [Penicillium lagena]|uniref:uncharacterized protein n=1 Tax=Penicillium lagena TaxID=94218 RepID=UPI0025424E8E|nr:uncharacterized protein N7510_001314 [Penicillium lagena]KAJ5625005.1 hypothetical protein N7510_001314 [Penicillium lagena]